MAIQEYLSCQPVFRPIALPGRGRTHPGDGNTNPVADQSPAIVYSYPEQAVELKNRASAPKVASSPHSETRSLDNQSQLAEKSSSRAALPKVRSASVEYGRKTNENSEIVSNHSDQELQENPGGDSTMSASSPQSGIVQRSASNISRHKSVEGRRKRRPQSPNKV